MRRRRSNPHLNRTLAGGGHAGCIRRQLGTGIAFVGRDTRIATRSESSILGFDREPDNGLGGRPCGAAVRGAAGCPYALFDLRFQDEGHWRLRLQNSGGWRVADESVADDETVNFVRLALFYAWHVASSAGLKAQLLLGMNGATAAAFRGITVNHLPALVATEAGYLSARWSGCTAYWGALTDAASRADPAALRRVQLYGLQLAAAARLSEP